MLQICSSCGWPQSDRSRWPTATTVAMVYPVPGLHERVMATNIVVVNRQRISPRCCRSNSSSSPPWFSTSYFFAFSSPRTWNLSATVAVAYPQPRSFYANNLSQLRTEFKQFDCKRSSIYDENGEFLSLTFFRGPCNFFHQIITFRRKRIT